MMTPDDKLKFSGTQERESETEIVSSDIITGPLPVSIIQAGPIRMACHEIGKGETLLLIMGLGGSMHEWDRTFLTHIAESFHLTLFDNRGVGDSEEGDTPLSIPEMAEDTYQLLTALGVSKAHVFGYSLGAAIALHLTDKHPELVDSLILYAPITDGEDVFRRIQSYIDPSLPELIRIQALLPDEFLDQHPDLSDVFPPAKHAVNIPMIYRQLNALRTYSIHDHMLSFRNKRILILVGSEDTITPPDKIRELARKLPHATVRIIPGGGHGMLYQIPEVLADLTRIFLDTSGSTLSG